MTELRRVRPLEQRAVEQPRPTAAVAERLTPADRPPAPRTRAETAEHRATSPPEPRDSQNSSQQQADRLPDALTRFEPRRAGLPDMSKDDANHYIETHQ